MCRIFRIVCNGFPSSPESRERFWLGCGESAAVSPGIDVTAFCDCDDGAYVPYLQVQTPGDIFEFLIQTEYALNLTSWAPLLIVPRALEVDWHGRALRMLLERASISGPIEVATQAQ